MPMLVTASPMVTLWSERQPLNTLWSMTVTASGMVIWGSDVQLANALEPMLVTLLFWKVTPVSAVQPWKVVLWIVVVSPPMISVLRAPMLWKGCSALV